MLAKKYQALPDIPVYLVSNFSYALFFLSAGIALNLQRYTGRLSRGKRSDTP